MFARRRKPRDGDEPLVPHGLVWQATDDVNPEAEPPAMQSKQRAVTPPVEMPVREPQPNAPALESPDANPAHPITSPPQGWPRVNGDEVTRRSRVIDTAVSFPYRKSPAPGPVMPPPTKPALPVMPPPPAQSNTDEARPRFMLPEQPKLTLIPSKEETRSQIWQRIAEQLSATGRRTRDLVRDRFSTASWQLVQLRTALTGRLRSTKAKKANVIRHYFLREQPVQQSNQPKVVQLEPPVEIPASRGSRLKAISLQSRLLGLTGGFGVRANTWGRVAAYHAGRSVIYFQKLGSTAAEHARRAWAFELKIRIKSDKNASLAAAAKSLYARINSLGFAIRLNQRLWTSMLMAGISAVLALVVITGTRQYRPATASPSDKRAAQSTVSQQQQQKPAAALARQPAAASTTSAEMKPSATASSAISPRTQPISSEKTSAPPTKPHRVRHQNADEDYVAEDTYTYYGVAGKPTSH